MTLQDKQFERELLTKIAQHLGEGWSVPALDPDDDYAYSRLVGPEGCELTFWDERTNKYDHYSHPFPSIKLSSRKTPFQIAHDIQLRILPEYRQVWEIANARKLKHFALRDAAKQFTMSLEDIGAKVHLQNDDPEQKEHFRVSFGRISCVYADLEVQPTEVNFKIGDVPHALAYEIVRVCMAYLNTLPKEEDNDA